MYRVTFMKNSCRDYASVKKPNHQTLIATTTPSSKALTKMEDNPVQHDSSADSSIVNNATLNEKNERKQVTIEIARLSKEDRVILKDVYKQLAGDKMRYGMRIMLGLFSEHPNYKNIWPQFCAIPDSSLMNAPQLRKHIQVYFHGLKNIIDNLSNEERILSILKKIVQAHVKWKLHRHHIINMLGPVLDAIKICTGSLTPEKKRAWTTLYEVIANLIEIFQTPAKNRSNRVFI